MAVIELPPAQRDHSPYLSFQSWFLDSNPDTVVSIHLMRSILTMKLCSIFQTGHLEPVESAVLPTVLSHVVAISLSIVLVEEVLRLVLCDVSAAIEV